MVANGNSDRSVLIVAGEASGDLHGSNLVREIQKLDRDLRFFGIGGDDLSSAGVEILEHSREMAVMGLTEVIGKLGKIFSVMRAMREACAARRPVAAILVDYPEFNLRLAKSLKAMDIPVFYYISPQVWAWRSGRVMTIRRLVTKMAVIFPFEKEFYRENGLKVEFVGHPLVDRIAPLKDPGKTREELGIAQGSRVVAIVPGSRLSEVRGLLGPLMDAAELLQARHPGLEFVLPVAPTLDRREIASTCSRPGVKVRLFDGRLNELVGISEVALVASGTATVETAIMGTPMVIVYRVSPLTYIAGRMFINVNSIGMVNLIAGRQVAPELIQGDATGPGIAAEAEKLLGDPILRASVKAELAGVRKALGEPGASARAAALFIEMLKEHNAVKREPDAQV
jgi:lipid-A-disaccharide synthase